MIFHPNPMIEVRSRYWEDKHLKKVVVKPILVNNSKNNTRWVVFKKGRHDNLETISRHITAEQAVVEAQTLANRLFRTSKLGRKKTKRVRTSDHVATIAAHKTIVTVSLTQAFDYAIAGNYEQAGDQAAVVIDFIKKNFTLR